MLSSLLPEAWLFPLLRLCSSQFDSWDLQVESYLRKPCSQAGSTGPGPGIFGLPLLSRTPNVRSKAEKKKSEHFPSVYTQRKIRYNLEMDTVVSRNPLERVWCLFWVLHFIFPLALPTPTTSSLMIDAISTGLYAIENSLSRYFRHTHPLKNRKPNKNENWETKLAKSRERL